MDDNVKKIIENLSADWAKIRDILLEDIQCKQDLIAYIDKIMKDQELKKATKN
jgi:hypothetical protein